MNRTHPVPARFSFTDPRVLFCLFLAAALVPWFFARGAQATNSDILWLCEAMQRYLDGMRMSDGFYDTNPPLSFLLYALPVLAQSFLHIPLHYGVFAQSCMIVSAFTLATWRILDAWKIFTWSEIYIVTTLYVVANTICASLYFGERDHLIGAVLLPFVLMQLTLTDNLPRARGWMWPVFAIGTVFILLKPHHGLLPSLLLLHRVIRRRDLSVLRDPDFLCLAAGTLLYTGLVFLLFPDFVTIILPDVLKLYVSMGGWTYVGHPIMAVGAATAAVAVLLRFIPARPAAKTLGWFMLFAGAVSLIPYGVQGKGLYYQIMPALVFFSVGAGLTLLLWLETQVSRHWALGMTAVFVLVFAYVYAPLNLPYPRHGDYAALPVSKILEKNCPRDRPCSFFMFNRDMGIVHETAYYMHMRFDSRFPSFWFMPKIVEAEQNLKAGKPAAFTRAELAAEKMRFTGMVAQDFAKWKPDVVLLWKSDQSFLKTDFVTYFTQDRRFSREWKHYRKAGSLTLSYADYYRGTRVKDEKLTYEIYRRIGTLVRP